MNLNCCTLCATPVSNCAYSDEDRTFCCAGCHAVYQILFAKQALDNFQEHPLFQQAVRSGIISNPDLIEQMRQRLVDVPEKEFERFHLEINDMWCPSCSEVIRLILSKEKGIRLCVVDYCTDLAVIEFTPRYISKEKIIRLISQLGYSPVSLKDPRQQAVSRSLYLRFIVAAFFSLNVMMFAYPIYASYYDGETLGYAHMLAWVSLVGSLPVLLYSAWPIWRRLYSALSVGVWGMELLVALGVGAATGLSIYELMRGGSYVYFDSMTVIIVLMLLGKIIESRAKFSAKDSLVQLTRALPRRGRKLDENGSNQFVPLKEILPGDRIVVLMGERIVLDGVVDEGEGSCDESVMTGESWPVAKEKGSSVLAGSLLQQGRLIVNVTAKSEETALHRIIDMVSQEIEYKSNYVRAADRIVRIFVPSVVALAILTGLYCWYFDISDPGFTSLQTAIIRAVSVLLISCPCAIGIAAPLAESYLLNALAQLGVIVRNRGCLALLGNETVFLFDKTGTITEGKMTILDGVENLSIEEKSLLKGLVSQSNHPIAAALNRNIDGLTAQFDRVEEVIGRGLKGTLGLDSYVLGSDIFFKQMNIDIPMISSSSTTVWFAKNQNCLTSLVLGDRIREEAPEVILALASLKPLLVSGDSPSVVETVARQCGFYGWHAGFHPLQKKELVDQLRKEGHIIAMLGDGINDAPALTSAHIGMAVVSATDISIQVSDLLLTTSRLHVIPQLRLLAQKGQKIIKQNLFWAFFYNVIGIGLAMTGVLTPLFAAFAMMISSLIVLLNAQRIR